MMGPKETRRQLLEGAESLERAADAIAGSGTGAAHIEIGGLTKEHKIRAMAAGLRRLADETVSH